MLNKIQVQIFCCILLKLSYLFCIKRFTGLFVQIHDRFCFFVEPGLADLVLEKIPRFDVKFTSTKKQEKNCEIS